MRQSTWNNNGERWYAELEQKYKDLQRQLDAVTAERDHLRKALELADALRNHQVQKLERRKWRRT